MRDEDGKGKCTANREVQIAQILGHARARGDATPEVEQVMDQVVAPLYYAVLFGRDGAGRAHAQILVERLLP